jgi:NDP-sugar pyrophosphorylase family protein
LLGEVPDEGVLIGLPDTVWFPVDRLARLPADVLAFLLFWVEQPRLFDAVVLDRAGRVREIQAKQPEPRSHWIWGAFRMPARTFLRLRDLWCEPGRHDEYVGTLVNAYIRRGGQAIGVKAGETYIDVGTIDGSRAAVTELVNRPNQSRRMIWCEVAAAAPPSSMSRQPRIYRART